MSGAEVRIRKLQSVQTQNMFGLTIAGNTVGAGALVSSGTLTLVGGNNITLSQVGGNAITISGPNAHNITLAGNSTSAGAGFVQISTGTMTLAGGTNITLSQNGNAVTIIGGAGGAGTTFSAGVSNLSNDSGQTGTVTNQIIFAGGNNITLSQASNVGGSATVTIIGPNTVAQSIQSYNILAAGTQTANTTGTVVLSNSNNVSFGMSNNSIVTASASFSQTVQPAANIAAGTQTATSGTVVFSNSNNISFGMSNNSVVTATATFSQTSNIINEVSILTAGNTAGLMADITSGTLYLAGGNFITLSQNANSITISGPIASRFSAGVSNSGNTAGTTGAFSRYLIFVGSNNITLSQSSVAGGSATITILDPANILNSFSISGNIGTTGSSNITGGGFVFAGGSNITLSQSNNSISIHAAAGAAIGIAAGTQTATSGTVVFSNSNSISFGMSNNSVVTASFDDKFNIIAAGSQTANTTQSVVFSNSNNVSFGMSNNSVITASAAFTDQFNIIAAGSQTAGTTQSIVFSNSNNVSFGMSNNSIITASATFSQSVQASSIINEVSILTAGNTAGVMTDITSGTLYLNGGNNITLSQNGNSITISGAAGGGINASISGNISGTSTLISSGTMILAGGNNITLSQNANSVTISALASSSLVQAGNVSISTNGSTITISGLGFAYVSLSTGNTSGTLTLISSGTMFLAGGNRITLSQVGNAITISGPGLVGSTHQHIISGNTSGTTAVISTGTMNLVGGNNITLSQNANSVTISGAQGIILVSNYLVTASAQVLSFTGANVTDHAYTFHMYISNPLAANPVYSVMFNGVSAGITRQYFQATALVVAANSDNNAYAFNVSSSEVAYQIINMMFYTSPVAMFGQGNDRSFEMIQQMIRQTDTAATNVTAIVISANTANAIGPNSRIIWYKHA